MSSVQLAVPTDALSASVSVAKADMLTWNGPNAMKEKGFHSASWWASRGFANLILCGSGHNAMHAACIPYSVSFAGTPTRIRLGLRILVTNSRTRTFHWALADARDDTRYLGKGWTKSAHAVAQGKLTAARQTGTQWQYFDLWGSSVPADGFIYLWRTASAYGNVHIEGASLDVYCATSATLWHEAQAYVYDGGWKPAVPHVYRNGAWTPIQ